MRRTAGSPSSSSPHLANRFPVVLMNRATNGGWMVQAMYFSMGKRHDYRAALRAVQAPVLVVHGENDLVPERMSRMYVDSFPNGRLHAMSIGKSRAAGRAGHFSSRPARRIGYGHGRILGEER